MTFALVAGALALGVATVLWRCLRPQPGNPMRRNAAVAAVAVPCLAAAIYLGVGNPEFADPGAALDNGPQYLRLLERQVEARPDAPGPLRNLAQALDEAGRPAEAAPLWQRAAALGEDGQADSLARAAQSLIMASDGSVTQEAAALLTEVLAIDPAHVPARFYSGLAELQAGQPAEAHATWTALLEDTPDDAEFRPLIEDGIREAAARADIAPSEPGSAPSMPNEAQIRAMVDGLAARLVESPDDLDGWKRLGRSRRVLNEFELSHEAYMQAIALDPQDVDALAGAAEALTLAAEDPAQPPPEALSLFRRVLDIHPDHVLSLYILGEEAARQNDTTTASRLLQRLLERLPPEGPVRDTVIRRLTEIGVD